MNHIRFNVDLTSLTLISFFLAMVEIRQYVSTYQKKHTHMIIGLMITPEKAVVFRRRPPTPAISRWTTCVKAARVLLHLGFNV